MYIIFKSQQKINYKRKKILRLFLFIDVNVIFKTILIGQSTALLRK